MTTLREAAQMALYALQESKPIDIDDPAAFYRSAHAIEALRVALAQPEREWQRLTDKDYEAMAEKYVTNCYFDTLKYARAIEAKLREKNT